MQLLTLVNGISSSGTTINTSQLSINGSRTLNTEIRLDGVSMLNNESGIPGIMPSQDALEEFRVSTSAYSAEAGRSSGGTVTAIIKSGTNHYHGSLYELFRNEAMDANNFFNNVRGLPTGADRYDQYGFAFGGPLWLPRLYNGRNRTFFFYNLDQTLNKYQSITTNSVPSAAFKSGDFSSATIAVNDPTTKTPFSGNIIPSSRLDPVALRVMSLTPLPTRRAPSIHRTAGTSTTTFIRKCWRRRVRRTPGNSIRPSGTESACSSRSTRGPPIRRQPRRCRTWF
jgi:hypothetical protein